MTQHYLTITECGQRYPRIFLNNNYVIGRVESKCEEILRVFDNAPTVITLKKSQYVSSFHCVLLQAETSYQLIDGWGQCFSTNGVYCNGQRAYFTTLKDNDLILLGSSDVQLLYESQDKFTVVDDQVSRLSFPVVNVPSDKTEKREKEID